MDIQEIKKLKRNSESGIELILNSLQKETGCSIEGVSLVKDRCLAENPQDIIFIQLSMLVI